MNLLFWKKPKRPVFLGDTVRVVPSSAQLKADKGAAAQAATLLSSPIGRLMVSVLQNESPMRAGQVAKGATRDDIIRAYGYEEGYIHCLQKLLSLGTYTEAPKELEFTFKDEAEEDFTWKQP